MNIKEKFWIGTFISLWVLVSTVSTFHAVEFFGLSNNLFFSWCIAIGFEIGAMASLGGLLINKGNKYIVWILFIILTAFQIHGNMYWAWSHAGDISEWTKLFDLVDEDPNFTKRIFSFVSGGILPLISLGFIKSLMDYMSPKEDDAQSDAVKGEELQEKLEELVDVIEENNKDISVGPETDTQTDTNNDYVDSVLSIENQLQSIEDLSKEFEAQSGPWDSSGPRKFERIPEEVIDDLLKPGELFEKGKQVDKQIDNNPLPPELNKKNALSKLGDIIDDAENTVNSIGEK